MMTYPCPFCGGQADLEAGCSGCGRAPFPDAAEVVRLGTRADELLVEVEAARAQFDEARSRYDAAVQRLNAVRAQRNMLAARVSQAVEAAKRALGSAAPVPVRPAHAPHPAAAPVPGPNGPVFHGPPAVPAAAPASAPTAAWTPASAGAWAPASAGGSGSGSGSGEASPRTVQNLLFILGGLLLGSAAIVFAAVAWASFGVMGRAAILATVTLITLAVPPFALSRGLRSTAETFAALGLLLVLLDGYAAWYVNLAGLADTTRPSTYTGLVCAVTAVIAGGYSLATGLRGPRFAAILTAQPVLPLLAAERSFEATGWTATFVAVAALDVLLARTVEKAAWVGAGIAVAVAGPLGLLALSTVDGVAGALGAGAVMLALAAVIMAAGLAHRVTAHIAAAVATCIVALVAVRILAEAIQGWQVLTFAFVPVLIALAATVLPDRVRTGARVGAFIVAGVAAVPFAVASLLAAGNAVDKALPVWHGPASSLERLFSWQVPAALVAVAAAFLVLTRSRLVVWPLLVLVALAAPGSFDAPLPVVSVLDFAALAGLAVAALLWSARAGTPPEVPLAATPPATNFPSGAPTDDTAPAAAGHPAAAGQPSAAGHPGSAGLPGAMGRQPGVMGSARAGVTGPARTGVPAGWWAALGLPVVAAHAVLVGLDTPLSTLLTMAGLIAVCAVFAVRGTRTWFTAPAVTFGLTGLPLLFAAAVRLVTAGGTLSVPAPMFGAVAGLALATALVTLARRTSSVAPPSVAQPSVAGASGVVAPDSTRQSITGPGAMGSSVTASGAGGAARGRAGTGGVSGAAGVFGVVLGGLGVTLAAVGLSAAGGGRLPFGVFAAVAVLSAWFATVGVARRTPAEGGPTAGGSLPAWFVPATLPAVIPAMVTLIAVAPGVVEALLRPYRWLGAVWQGTPDGVGLDPTGRWWAGEAQAFGAGPAAVALGLVAVLAVLVARRTRTAVWTLAGAPATLAVVLGCVAAEAPWPVVPAVTLAGGLATALAAALVRPGARATRVNVGAFTCWFTAGAGFAGCLATKPVSLAALAAVLVTAAVIGVAGRSAAARTLGWLVGAVSAGWLAFAAARAAELPLRWAGYWVLLAAAVVLATSVVIRRLRTAASAVRSGPVPISAARTWAPPTGAAQTGAPQTGAPQAGAGQTGAGQTGAGLASAAQASAGQADSAPGSSARGSFGQPGVTWANVTQASGLQASGAGGGEGLVLEVVAHAMAVVAFLLTGGDLAAMAGISSLWGLALGLRALAGGPRVAFAGVAGAAQLVAYWLVLASNEVALLEAYTLPAGAIAAGIGWYASRRRPVGAKALGSWVAYGPALLAAFGPSLASVLVTEGEPVRRLLLGAGALAVVVVGAVRRLQAPTVVGAVVLTVVALHEIAVYWDLLPRWAPLAVAGLVLVALATTYERRIRDVRRIRSAVTRMR
ncbi:hypothetical protein [Dactylosporangium sp. NPDC005555]|uniref:SCO7613 C-terminal domain-containing membrane protein n=1 Tax=Dactylosporangium sp. NPDC005555 TaxID=3154889 RepID=UPI0033A4265D